MTRWASGLSNPRAVPVTRSSRASGTGWRGRQRRRRQRRRQRRQVCRRTHQRARQPRHRSRRQRLLPATTMRWMTPALRPALLPPTGRSRPMLSTMMATGTGSNSPPRPIKLISSRLPTSAPTTMPSSFSMVPAMLQIWAPRTMPLAKRCAWRGTAPAPPLIT